MPSFWREYPEIINKLEKVQELMTVRLRIDNAEIQKAISTFILKGGKMIRPALFFLFLDIAGQENPEFQEQRFEEKEQNDEKFIKIASSIEMLHSATLIHDDIIDDSPLRRGLPSLESQFGKDTAVYAGDFIYTIYFELLCETMADTPLLLENARSMKKILRGELSQKRYQYRSDLSSRQYLKNIKGKTAELLSFSCYEGAYFSGGSQSLQKSARKIGLAVGLAFQIYDDWMNFKIGKEPTDKPILNDIRQGIFTLPLLIARENNPDEILPFMERAENLSDEECEELAALVETSGGMSAAMEIAKSLTDKALLEIEKLPKTNSQKILSESAKKLLQRKS